MAIGTVVHREEFNHGKPSYLQINNRTIPYRERYPPPYYNFYEHLFSFMSENLSPEVCALSELLWHYLQQAMIPDLIAFSNHRSTTSPSTLTGGGGGGSGTNKRSVGSSSRTTTTTIVTQDVALMLRKIPDLLQQFQQFVSTSSHHQQGRSSGAAVQHHKKE
jgi:hypothetical protein